LAALLCELCGYKLFLFSVSAQQKVLNPKIAKKVPHSNLAQNVRLGRGTQPLPTTNDQRLV